MKRDMKNPRFSIMLGSICLAAAMVFMPYFQSQQALAKGTTENGTSSLKTDFFTSFENGDPQPTWDNRVNTTRNGKKRSSGVQATAKSDQPMQTHVGNGPDNSYTAKTHVGWTGLKALSYSGYHVTKGRAYSYNKLFSVNIKVTPETQLSYYIHPEFTDSKQLDYSSTYVSVDLEFSDGTYLSKLGAIDQHGIKMNAEAQGKSKTVYNNQWNHRVSDIGKVAAGKTIKKILVDYDDPTGRASFKGSIDDIQIKGHPQQKTPSSPADYVNILRGTNSNGTFSRGNNIPVVAVPHGFNFWTPATNAGTLSWLYSYQQDNNSMNLPEIQAFSLSHEPSPWMGDRQTFQVMPSASKADKPPLNRKQRALAFKHSNEVAKPYDYKVKFVNGIQTEMAPTNHAAMFKFSFTGNTSNLIFDNVNNNGGLTLQPDSRTITGYTDVKSGLSDGATRMFIYAKFDKSVAASGKLTGEGRDNVAGYYRFNTSGSDKTVTMKIATSLISLDQAKKNLDQEIHPNDTIATVRERAKQLWNNKLDKIQVQGATRDQLTTLYSNLYRVNLYPNAAYENTGNVDKSEYQYASQFSEPPNKPTATKTGAKIEKGKPYVNNGFWDTYRTAWPAYALLYPKEAGSMINGFVQQYKDGGWISRWSSPGYANLMVGTSADAAFSDAYMKGIRNFDVQSFFNAAIKDASVVSPNPATGRKGLDTSIFKGYTSTGTSEGMSWAMAGYINDSAIANMAKAFANKAGNKDPKYNQYMTDYQYYRNRAKDYVKLFNPKVHFFMGKKSNGDWRTTPENFDPRAWGGDYTETNAWGMAFTVPQDGQGLANLYGGRKALAKKLDQFFSTKETALRPGAYGGTIHEMREARDVRMGMYGHSNQPAHHIIYMYDYTGQPWKAQAKIREVLSRLYIGSSIGQGYPGDEDNGEMSAWYILSAMGIYPLQQGTSDYVIGAPFFKKMTIHLENGKDLVINAPKVSNKNKYIQSLKVNGKPYNKLTISHSLLAKGGTLDFEMGPNPSKWGTGKKALPKSITDKSTNGSSLVPDPMGDLTGKGKGNGYGSDKTVANNLFDNTSDTQQTIHSKHPWVQYDFTNGSHKALMYTITSSKKDSSEDPKSWTLIGSNDTKKWTVLDKRAKESFKWRQFTRPFKIQNPGKYKYYRLIVQKNGGADTTSIAQIEFLGYGDLGKKFDQVQSTYQSYVKSGDIKGAEKVQLSHSLKQAQKQFNDEHDQQSAKQLNDFLKHLEHAKQGQVSSETSTKLNADVNALKVLVLKDATQPPRGNQQYQGTVQQVAVFKASNLKISSVEPGKDAKISAVMTNIGLVAGDSKAYFYYDGNQIHSKTFTLKPGENQTVSFTVKDVSAGLHQVKINNLTGTLKAIYPNKPVLSLHFGGAGATVEDSSPYAFNGTMHGNATRVSGKFGKALKLDGGYVEIPNKSLLNGGDAITVSAWVNLSNPKANQKILGKTTIGNGYLMGVQSNHIYPELWDTGGNYSTFQSGTIPANQWTQIAFTWQKGGSWNGYVNGKQVKQLSTGSDPIKPNNAPLIIGAAPWDANSFQMHGLIDEVKIYPKALSADQMQQLYQNNSLSGN